jgi:hypothetical protein
MMIVFRSDEDHKATIRRAPFTYLGHEIKLERPEDGENRFAWAYTSYAQVSVMGFPLEHWNKGGIRTAFRSVGSVCCIDPLCLNELDFAAVRLVLRLEQAMDVPRTLLLRDFDGELTAEVQVHVVCSWEAEDALSDSSHFCFIDGGRPKRTRRMDSIDSDSVRGSPPRPRPREACPMELWQRILTRKFKGESSFSAHHAALGPVAPPLEEWKVGLAQSLASQFPDAGFSAAQVIFSLLFFPSLPRCLYMSVPKPSPVLLLQWYDTLGTPADPIVVSSDEDVTPTEQTSPLPCRGDQFVAPVALAVEEVGESFALLSFAASDVHEDTIWKQRVKGKMAADRAFKKRTSSRLAAKESKNYLSMAGKASARASRFDTRDASPRLRAAARAAGFGDKVPGHLPLHALQALGAPCGIDAAAIATTTPETSGVP